jgi:tRNA (Thr-GGU) A37 N-methylase
VLTWLDLAARDVLVVRPRDHVTRPRQGVFSTRSADRPKPVGVRRVDITGIDGSIVRVSNLEAVLALAPYCGHASCRVTSSMRTTSRVANAHPEPRDPRRRRHQVDVPTMYHANGKQRGIAGNNGDLTRPR